MATIADNWNGTDGSIATAGRTQLNWTIVTGTCTINTNRAAPGGTGSCHVRCSSALASVDQYVQVTVLPMPTTNDRSVGIRLRHSTAANTAYEIEVNRLNSRFTVSRTVMGVGAGISGFVPISSTLFASSMTLRGEVQGSTIRVYINGTLMGSYTDTTITTGTSVGIRGFNCNNLVFLDDFSAGDLVAATTAPAGSAAGTGQARQPSVAAAASTTAVAGVATGVGQARHAIPPAPPGTRRNEHTNPRLATNADGMTLGGLAARSTSLTGTSTTTGATLGVDSFAFLSTAEVITAGETWTCSVEAARPAGQVELKLEWFDALGIFISSETAYPALGTTGSRVSVTGVAPPGAVRINFVQTSFITGTGTIELTKWLIEKSPTASPPWFDGDTAGAVWTGTPGNSASVLAATTTAAAGHAAGTGAAHAAAASTTTPAAHAAGTGAARPAVAQLAAVAGVATGTGMALVPLDRITTAAAAAAAAGAAYAAAVSTSVTAAAGTTNGTGQARQPTVATASTVTAPAGAASGTGAAHAPTALTASTATAPAGAATGTGAARAPAVELDVTAGPATGTGTAAPAAVATGVTAPASAATGAGTAQAATVDLRATAGTATGTGSGWQAAVRTAQPAPAGAASGTGTARQPVVTVAASGAALAGTATGTGEAFPASTTTSQPAPAARASGAGTAHPATAATSQPATAGHATGTGAARQPSVTVASSGAAPAGSAAGTGIATQPAVRVTVSAAPAAGTGTAQPGTVTAASTTTAPAARAAGVGAAHQPGATAASTAAAGPASGTGTARAATSAITVVAVIAAGSGSARPARGQATPKPDTAAGVGQAHDAEALGESSGTAVARRATGTGRAWPASVLLEFGVVPPATGWLELAAQLRTRQLVRDVDGTCPNDGEPLQRARDGSLVCPFDGWRPEERFRRPAEEGRDWGGLRAAMSSATPPRTEMDDDRGWGGAGS